MEKPKKLVVTAVLAGLLMGLAAAPQAYASQEGDGGAILLDLLVLRPVGLVTLVAGSVIFVGALPFSLPSRSVGETFDTLVKHPAYYTFIRHLGDDK
ncbi:MAG: hypothetical protein M0039_07905 [Pseudomonadota bacterium]|nr:hypothetical protein [Pseudomonadota bacterium]